MRLRKATMPRAPITNTHELSRAFLALSKIEPDIEFSASVEYPEKPDGKKSKKSAAPWVECWTLELTFNEPMDRKDEEEDEEDDEDYLDSIVVQVRELEDGSFDFKVDVEDGVTRANLDDFDDFEQVYEHVYELVYPTPKSKGQPAAVAPALVPSLKLVQQSIAHGPQSIWLSHLDITKVNSNGNGLIDFRVPCAMVGYSVHIADMRHFLKAIKFDLSVLESKPHNLFSNVQKELIARIGGAVKLATPGATGKVTDSQGAKYLVFTLQTLGENSSVVHGMIDLRPEDFPNGEEDEEDDDTEDFQ